MPTNRKRCRRPSQAQPWITEYLLYGCYTLPSGKRSILKTLLFGETPVPAWADVRDELLPQWIKDHPGSRPFSWWGEEAPESRRRIGGTGEISEDSPRIEFGAPGPTTWWAGVLPGDPPTYESQAAYLQRHNLLTPPEKKWLSQHAEALKPEKITYLCLEQETGFCSR